MDVPAPSPGTDSFSLRSVGVGVKKWPHFKGPLPKYESLCASGFDVRAQLESTVRVSPLQRVLIPTGLSFEIPRGFELQVRPRSGVSLKQGLSVPNSPGTIDSDYRGELKVIMINYSQREQEIEDQKRIAQVVLCPVFQARFVEVQSLSRTVRGGSGFGSTGS